VIWNDDLPGMKPGDERTLTEDGHTFKITATDQLGCDTGRRRYRVDCVTCNEVVHEATTGPRWNVGFHVREAHRRGR
jgi:hypothetical protein